MNDKKPFDKVPSLFSLDKDKAKPGKPAAPASNLEPEYQEAYDSWKQNQTPDQNDMIIGKINPIIDSAVKSYAGQEASPSVRLQARRMALEGLKGYDPSKSKLKTHMMWHMQGLKRAAAKSSQILNVPERVRIDSHYVNASFKELEDQLGRDPNDDELANYTGLSNKRIERVRGYKPGLSEGAASQGFMGSESDDVSDPSSSIPGQQQGQAWRGFVYDGLDDRAKLIMEHTFGMNGKSKLDNIGVAKKLRITPARVSQIRSDIQNKMDGRERMGLL
jgi:DNA-directed RNA polymerase specialized sigma subunit